ncbi:MAG: diacylglycerol kinase [Rhodobacteraceae bacterium]|nr:diacylglycerol kinase [Paracoccaceae bacterium]
MIGWLRAEALRLGRTVLWSWQGWRAAWATERTLRQWTLVHAASVALAFALDLSAGERALIVALGFLLLAAELMNTAIEEVVDHLSPQRDPRARKAKDCGSAAVALAALGGGAAWLVILLG